MEAFQTATTTAISGVAAALFVVGAVYIGVPAAKFTIRSIASLLGR